MSYPTMPNPALQPRGDKKKPARPAQQPQLSHQAATRQSGQPIPRPQPQPHKPLSRPQKPIRRKFPRWIFLLPVIFVGLGFLVLVMSLLAVNLAYANKILPKVTVAGLDVGGMTVEEAQSTLSRNQSITLVDNERTWNTTLSAIGLTLDVARTADAALAERGAWFKTVDVAPIIIVDEATLRAELERMSSNFHIAPVNAGVELVNGQVQATDPQMGRTLNIDAMVAALVSNASDILADGEVELIMAQIQPTVMDATPIVRQAESLLGNPLELRVYDPVTGDSVYWSVNPEQWGQWLTATSDANSPIGLSLDMDAVQLDAYLSERAARTFDDTRTIDTDAAVASIRQALLRGRPQDGFAMVKHLPRTHVVQPGESLTSIGWDYGIPYLYIIEANGGLQDVSVGQTINIPPADVFLDLETNPNKRIVIDIGEQRTRVYENGELLYDWLSSTGIASSPTWTGVYQVLSHEPNAYAANWNLYMPNFIGIYQPVPNAEFTNGFHGFPTRGGGQLLWENSLGTRVTYGCILLHDQHVQILYDWAETGVVVEINP